MIDDYSRTVRECIEDIREAQRSLDKAYYHLRIAVELSMHNRGLDERERTQSSLERFDSEDSGGERDFTKLHRT